MLSTMQVFVEVTIAIALMITIGIIAGFITAGITGDRVFSIGAGLVTVAATGMVLGVRLWRMTRTPLRPPVHG